MAIPRFFAVGVVTFLMVAYSAAIAADVAERGIVTVGSKEPDKVERRTALVVGNSAYEDSPLKNPVNDARAMASILGKLGFEVVEKENLTMAEMLESINQFGKKIRQGGVAIFYFAGHGVQFNGENYLIPIKSGIELEEHVRYRAVNIGEVLAQMEVARNRLNIVILDACRNNPFKKGFRSTINGLANMNAPKGTLIAYATAPGATAKDGDGKNGLFTQELIKVMGMKGLKIEEIFKRVRILVQEKTNDQQLPWESSSLVGDFYFSLPEFGQPDPLRTTDSVGASSVLNMPVDQQAIESPTLEVFGPFLGRWEGEWKFERAGRSGTRPCKLSVYVLDGQGYVDYYMGKVQSSLSFRKSSPFETFEEKKLKAEVKILKGVSNLVFTLKSGREFLWTIDNGKLIARLPDRNSTGTLYKAK